jgi:hypothetical protein
MQFDDSPDRLSQARHVIAFSRELVGLRLHGTPGQ